CTNATRFWARASRRSTICASTRPGWPGSALRSSRDGSPRSRPRRPRPRARPRPGRRRPTHRRRLCHNAALSAGPPRSGDGHNVRSSMEFLTSFFIQNAWAQGQAAQPDPLMSFLPLILIIVVFYFLLIRPQTKRQKEHRQMIEALGNGDEVVTGGGLLGKIKEVGDQYVTV